MRAASRVRSFVALVGLLAGCSSFGRPVVGVREFDYSVIPGPSDPFSGQVAFWQTRQRADTDVRGGASGGREISDSLGDRYDAFVSSQRYELARSVVAWAQATARARYEQDHGEYWPTFDELRRTRAEDCDGLELMIYRSLQAFGFERERLFRAVIEDRAGQMHMVTLWFEDATDPWVLDPTGLAAVEPTLMSALEDWTPRRVFREDADYSVRPRAVR